MPKPPFAGPGRYGPERDFVSRLGVDTLPRVQLVAPNSARVSGGTALTITGANFRNDSSGNPPVVTINGLPCTSVVVVSATQITCLSPVSAAAGLFDVVVTEGSQSATLVAGFTLYAGTITSVTPEFDDVNGGEQVVVKGYNFIAGSTFTFGGAAALNVTFVDDQHYVCVVPSGVVGFVDVVMTETGGATNTLRHGFQYTTLSRGNDFRRQPGIGIQTSLNNTPNTASLVIDGESNAPKILEQITITDEHDGDRVLFKGAIQSRQLDYQEQTDQLIWSVKAIDPTFILNKYRPFGRFILVSATDVVKAIAGKYAPGFTTEYVQTALLKISISFDGTDDFSTCLDRIAAAIGAAHWYVDYSFRIHFFHTPPPDVQVPTLPQSVLRLGPATPLTATQSPTVSPFWYTPGYYVFATTFVYDNGVESALGQLSNYAILNGVNYVRLTNIPVGVAAGTLNVVKRRIYVQWYGSPTSSALNLRIGSSTGWKKFLEIEDNVTTVLDNTNGQEVVPNTLEPTGAAQYPSLTAAIPATSSLPFVPTVAPPAAPTTPLALRLLLSTDAIANGGTGIQVPDGGVAQAPPAEVGSTGPTTTQFQGGAWKFIVTYLYRDGSESLPTESGQYLIFPNSTGSFSTDASGFSSEVFCANALRVASIPIGPTINGVDVIARKIYGHYLGRNSSNPILVVPEYTNLWRVIPNNTTTAIDDLAQQIAGLMPTGATSTTAPLSTPVWPNADGPSLESFDLPADINDTNQDLLRDPAFSVTDDGSQLQNRVIVIGGGSTLVAAALVGATTIVVADGSAFIGGGSLITDTNLVIPFFATGAGSESNPNVTVFLSAPLSQALPQGTAVNGYTVVQDIESQKTLALVERDKDGNPTDGVHENVVRDNTLVSEFQRYIRGHAQLELYAYPVKTIKYGTRDPNSRRGALVHVDLTYPPCFGDFLIQTVDIDQVHDESDTLTPRYTVTACSVRFTLNDLLLQILLNKGDGSVGSSGVVTGATNTSLASLDAAVQSLSAQITAVTGNLNFTPKPQQRKWWMGEISTASGGIQQSGIASVNQVGSSAGFIDAVSAWKRYTTASVGTNGMDTTGGWTWWDHAPEFDTNIRVGTIVSAVTFWAILLSANPPSSGHDIHTSKGVGVFASDTQGWTPVSSDGTTQTTGSVMLAFAPNTTYVIQIKWLSNTVAQITINGVTATITVGAGALGTLLDAYTWNCSATFSGQVMDTSYMYGERN